MKCFVQVLRNSAGKINENLICICMESFYHQETWPYWKIRKINYTIVYILYQNMLAMFSSPVPVGK